MRCVRACLPVRARRTGGQVQRDHRQLAVVGFEEAPFGVEFLHAEAHDNALRLAPAVQRDASVALLLGRMQVPLVSLEAERPVGEIRLLRLYFLQADDVGLLRGEPAEHALPFRGADAVHIQRDDPQSEASRWESWKRRRAPPTTRPGH